MVRPSAKHTSARLVLICAGLLGLALIADFLWASSPRFANSYISIASNWAPPLDISKPSLILTPKKTDDEVPEKGNHKNDTAHGRVLSATFADLPGPELKWENMAAAPVARLDGAAIQIKNLLFVFAGYGTIDYVHSHVDIYNFSDNTWGGRFDMPKEMAHSHLGMVTDGRYIYIVTGQYGPQCRGPTAHTFVLDTETKQWRDMPPLPVPRYAPATQLWRGRLHVMGGSKENRYTPGVDHWSLAVKDGKALEKEWRTEMPIPRGGPHRTTSGPVSSGGMPGPAFLKKSNSGPLNKQGEPLKKSSGPQSGGVTPTGSQNSGPLPPVLPATGLIISGPIYSGPLNASGPPRQVSGPLESMGSMKVQGSSIVHNQAITTLSQDDEFSFRKSFPKLILWSFYFL